MTMDRKKIVTVGKKQYLIAISESDGNWHALVATMPPQDGRTHHLPQWHCDASSEAGLNDKIEEHFQKVLQAQNTQD